MTKDKTNVEEILMKLDFEVFGLLSDLALAVNGEEVETKVQEIQAIIEGRFGEVQKQVKDQVQAECENAYNRGYDDGMREEHTNAMKYIEELRKEQREHE